MEVLPDDLRLLFSVWPEAKREFEKAVRSEVDRYKASFRSEREHEHDSIVSACASASATGGRIHRKSGFFFFSSEPLFELSVLDTEGNEPPKCFDLAMIRPESRSALLVEVRASKLSQKRTAYADDVRNVWDKAKDFDTHLDYFGGKVGFALEYIEYILCVPAEMMNSAQSSVYVAERDWFQETGDISIHTPLKLWLCSLAEDRRIQLACEMRREDHTWNTHRCTDLTKILRDGVSLGGPSQAPEIDMPCFPSSPSWQQATAVILDILEARLDVDSRSQKLELLRKPISREEIVASLAGLLRHYAAEDIAQRLADTLIENMLSFDVLRGVSLNRYVLTSSGRTLSTVVRDFQKRYVEGLAQRKARTRAAELIRERYRETTPTLFDFDE